MIKQAELQKIVRFCRKNGIVKLKSGDLEIELAVKPAPHRKVPEMKDSAPEFPSWDSLSPEQRLLWSSTPDNGGFGGGQ